MLGLKLRQSQFRSIHQCRSNSGVFLWWLHYGVPVRSITTMNTSYIQKANSRLLLSPTVTTKSQIMLGRYPPPHGTPAIISWQQQQQQRTYVFFPTSWKEFELRWLQRKFREQKRIVYVRLLRPRQQMIKFDFDKSTKGGDTAVRRMLPWDSSSTSSSSSRPPPPTSPSPRKSMNPTRWRAAKIRWKARSVAAQNRFLRKTRNYADRVQRVWNRHLVRVTTAYLKFWKPRNSNVPITTTTTTIRTQPIVLTEYSESSWFCRLTGRPIASQDATGRYVNPWLSESTAGVKSMEDIARWQLDRLQRTSWRFLAWCFGNSNAQLQQASSVAIENSFATLRQQSGSTPLVSKYDKDVRVPSDEMKLTWIGHSTCLLQQGSIHILTDPIFSERCSPFQSLPIGVARDIPAGLSIRDLPTKIDICLISHDHYDHLDKESILLLHPYIQLWVVPLGIKGWLHDTCNISMDQIIELEWWESVKLRRGSGDESNDKWVVVSRHSAIQNPTHLHPAFLDDDRMPLSVSQDKNNTTKSIWLTCCPAQHWGSRTFLDRNFRLWCSFAVFFQNGSKFYFGGDTALPTNFPLFDQIRDYIGGNVDLAAIPIGAYEPSFYMADSHVNPSEAVRIHQILNVKQSVGIHWGTFALSEEPIDQPPYLLHAAAQQAKVEFTTIRQGEAITVKCPSDDEAKDDNVDAA
jgi:N-acyl-phosphatidylethanolamine-hydrolysing phospholipase D